MVEIAEVPTTQEVSTDTTDKDTQLSMADIGAAVDAINLEYNKSTEVLANAELEVQSVQYDIYKLLISIHKKNMSTDTNTLDLSGISYNEVFTTLIEAKDDAYTKQSTSFRLLQKLQTANSKYLVGIINSLQQQLTQATTVPV